MKRGSKIAWGAVFVVVIALAGWVVLASWTARIAARREMELLLADRGATRIADLVPAVGTKGGPTHYIDLERFTLKPVSLAAGRVGDPLTSEEQKLGAAYEQSLTWRGLSLDGGDARQAEWDKKWEPYLAKHIEANAAQLAYVKEQAALGTGAFEVDWTAGFNALLPHLTHIRHATRALSLEATLRAKKGDAAGAYEDIRLMFRLGRLLEREPTLVARLVSIAADSITVSTLHGVMEEVSPDRASAQALLAELEGHEERGRMMWAFLGETAIGLETLELASKDPAIIWSRGQASSGGAPNRWVLRALRLFWNVSADRRRYLEIMRGLRESSRLPFPERKTDPLSVLPTDTLGRLRAPFTSMMTPALWPVLDQETLIDAKVALARAAIALELYRAERGEFPETLEALAPGYVAAVPTDPFDLQAVRYKLTEGGYTVWTVGLDGKDQGGATVVDMIWVKRAEGPAEAPEAAR